MKKRNIFVACVILLSGLNRASADDAHQCAVDLCGPARPEIGWAPMGAKLSADVEKKVEQTLDPKIDQLINMEIKAQANNDATLDVFLDRFEKQKPSGLEEAIVNFGVITEMLSNLTEEQELTILTSDENGAIQVNKDQFQKIFSQIPSDKSAKLADGLAVFLANRTIQWMQSIDSRMPLDLFMEVQREFSGQPDLRSVAAHMQDLTASLDAQNMGFSVLASQRKIIAKVNASGKLAISDQRAFILAYSSMHILLSMTTLDMVTALSDIHLTGEEIKSLAHLTPVLNQAKALLASPQKVQAFTQDFRTHMRQAVRGLVASGATDSELAYAQQVLGRVRQTAVQAIETMAQGTDPVVMQRAQAAILSAQIELPVNQQQSLDQATELLMDDMNDLQTREAKIIAAAKNPSLPFAVMLAAEISGLGKVPSGSLMDIRNLTEEYDAPGPEDAAYWNTNQMRVGWQTIKNPAMGIGVFAHELGHIASHQINPNIGMVLPAIISAGTLPVKECTVKKHEESESLFDATKPLYQAEEDWADAFAVAVIKRWGKASPAPLNTGCLLLDYDQDKKDYKDLSFKNSFTGDIHSSSFYRLIQIQSGMGSVPDSCVRASSQPKGADFFQSCAR